jgi:hypothetical protein
MVIRRTGCESARTEERVAQLKRNHGDVESEYLESKFKPEISQKRSRILTCGRTVMKLFGATRNNIVSMAKRYIYSGFNERRHGNVL